MWQPCDAVSQGLLSLVKRPFFKRLRLAPLEMVLYHAPYSVLLWRVGSPIQHDCFVHLLQTGHAQAHVTGLLPL